MSGEQAGSEAPALGRLEHEIAVFVRRLERTRFLAASADPGQVLDRSAHLLLGQLADNGPARLSALSATFGLDASTVSRQVSSLEAAGLLERVPDPTDARASLLRPTGTGRDRLAATRTVLRGVLQELLADWPEDDRAQFGRLLARYNEAAEARLARLNPAAR